MVKQLLMSDSKQDIHHFQVTAIDLDSANGLEGLNVLIGSQAIVSRDFSDLKIPIRDGRTGRGLHFLVNWQIGLQFLTEKVKVSCSQK